MGGLLPTQWPLVSPQVLPSPHCVPFAIRYKAAPIREPGELGIRQGLVLSKVFTLSLYQAQNSLQSSSVSAAIRRSSIYCRRMTCRCFLWCSPRSSFRASSKMVGEFLNPLGVWSKSVVHCIPLQGPAIQRRARTGSLVLRVG